MITEERLKAATEEACRSLDEWLAEKHPESECDGECVTTRRIFVEQAKAVIRERLAAARADGPDLAEEVRRLQVKERKAETLRNALETSEADRMAVIKRIESAETEVRRLREALTELVEALDEVHDSAAYQAVWVMYQVHHGKYTGPTYTNPHMKARAALAKEPHG